MLKQPWVLVLLVSLAGLVHAEDDSPAEATPKPGTASPNVHILPPLTIAGLGRERTLRVYLPPGYKTSQRRYPVLYMHDAQNLFDAATSFAGEWQVDETLDRLARERGLELIVVGIDNGGEHRLQELTAWDSRRGGHAEGAAYMAFVVDVVKPYVDEHYRTLADRAHTAIMGSSLGALISHYAIHRYRGVFGKAGLFSPSYWYAPGSFDYTDAHHLPRDTRLYFYCGAREDESMVRNMQLMIAHERRDGVAADAIASHVVADAGHNEAAWAREFPQAVLWLFADGATGPQSPSGRE